MKEHSNIKSGLFEKLLFSLLVGSLFFSAFIPAESQGKKNKSPIVLESLTPKLDTSTPASSKMLEGLVQDSFNPEVLSIPKSGFTKAYEIGRQLFSDGDYTRAINAFKLSYLRASSHGTGDPRAEMAKKAVDLAKSKINLASRLGFKVQGDNSLLKGKVEKVFPPSVAWLAGIKAGDSILKSQIGKTDVTLFLKRGSKTFNLTLAIPAPADSSLISDSKTGTNSSDSGFGAPIKHPELLAPAVKLLGNYDCYLLVDASGSMAENIQEAKGERESKWKWCQSQSSSFYNDVSKFMPQGITFVPFNHQFSVVPNCRGREIQTLFTQLGPQGGTDIAGPLDFVISDYLGKKQRRQKTRPIAIAVMTDGECGLQEIADTVIDATNKMTHPKEIVITFLSIGDTTAGSPVLKALDDDLVAAGAKYDIVDTRSFDELSKYGLTKALAAALIEEKVEK